MNDVIEGRTASKGKIFGDLRVNDLANCRGSQSHLRAEAKWLVHRFATYCRFASDGTGAWEEAMIRFGEVAARVACAPLAVTGSGVRKREALNRDQA